MTSGGAERLWPWTGGIRAACQPERSSPHGAQSPRPIGSQRRPRRGAATRHWLSREASLMARPDASHDASRAGTSQSRVNCVLQAARALTETNRSSQRGTGPTRAYGDAARNARTRPSNSRVQAQLLVPLNVVVRPCHRDSGTRLPPDSAHVCTAERDVRCALTVP